MPEAFAICCTGQDLWELQSKNIWGPKVWSDCSKTLTPEIYIKYKMGMEKEREREVAITVVS